MLNKIAFAPLVLALTLFSSNAMATTCSSYTYTLSNGSTADATQVMADLNDIMSCANTNLAPLASPHFTGSVGIGTTTPLARLEVNDETNSGIIALTRDAGSARGTLQFGRHNGGTLQVAAQITGISDPGGLINGALYFYATNSSGGLGQMMVILGNGNVGIGTTGPATALHVVGTIRQTNCTTAGTLSANTSGDIICTSDGRLKHVLGNYTTGLDALAQITPKLFTYKPTASDPVETFVHAGFIAQNVMTVIPQASALQHDGYYSLDTTAVLAATVNSVKQLKALADKQAAQIAALLAVSQKQAALIAALQRRGHVRTAEN